MQINKRSHSYNLINFVKPIILPLQRNPFSYLTLIFTSRWSLDGLLRVIFSIVVFFLSVITQVLVCLFLFMHMLHSYITF